jgi:molybdopterin converting factor small subunit
MRFRSLKAETMTDIVITVRLFGAFRPYGERVNFKMPSGSTAQDVKERLAAELKLENAALVNDSALANDNEIIGADAVFTQDSHLAILPPVCGG